MVKKAKHKTRQTQKKKKTEHTRMQQAKTRR